jgi:hypothetical protein
MNTFLHQAFNDFCAAKNCNAQCSFPEKTAFFGKAADQVIRYAFDLG